MQLSFKPGALTYLIVGSLLFLCVVVGGYFPTGKADGGPMVDRDASYQEFWIRNPHLEQQDSNREPVFFWLANAKGAMLDLAVVSDSEARPQSCDEQSGAAGSMAYRGATQTVCFSVDLSTYSISHVEPAGPRVMILNSGEAATLRDAMFFQKMGGVYSPSGIAQAVLRIPSVPN